MNEQKSLITQPVEPEYEHLVNNISTLWQEAKNNAALSVNTELLMANWHTGEYIVEYEQGGKAKAEYGKQLLVNLSKDLTLRNGKGFSRSNLTYMRKFYLVFPKCETVSHKLTWSHYFELLKCDDQMELQFYFHEAEKEGWKVRTKKSKKLTDFCLINATSTAGEADKFHDYIEKEYDTTKTLIRIINTGTIDPYVCLWGERRFIDKGENLITPYLLNNETVLGKNRYKMYNSIKIVFAKMANKTEAFLDEEGCYASINTNCLHTFKNISPKYVLGWIHSFVFNFIYGVLFDGLRMAGGYLPYSAPYLSCMVIPTATEEQQQEIIVLVDKILAAKKQDSSANTKEWEKQIDQKVYKLYGLTTEEIAIVEGK